jgi:hypothetical protein
MADDLLIAIDDAFASRSEATLTGRRPRVMGAPDAHIVALQPGDDVATATRVRALWDLPWLEMFIAVQFLWGAFMFLPGVQQYRAYVRALPYLSSLGLLVIYLAGRMPGSRPRGSGWLVSALVLLVANLLHPTSQLSAGLAQCVFQLSIAAPLFWVYKAVRSPRQLERLLVLMFAMNFASAALGILQVYLPDRFLPAEFSSQMTKLNDTYLGSMTYVGTNGRVIIRPPGLSDLPGGAAIAGGLTALLGLGLSLRTRRRWHMPAILASGAIGLAVVYLTQVRSVLLMVIGCGALLSLLVFRWGRLASATWISVSGAALVIAAFFWASAIGGGSVQQRFLNIRDQGVLQTYQENRGHYLTNTFGELLDEFPLGAGVGRWGMMNTYFGDASNGRSTPLYVEPQITGWLLDGGMPMWLFYGGAILFSVIAGFRLMRSPDPEVVSLALIVVPLLVFIVGLGMAGPVFNTQLGILFWMLASALHGAAQNDRGGAEVAIGGERAPISAKRNSKSFAVVDSPAGRA